MDFVWLKSPYPEVPDFLLTTVYGFRESEEYRQLNSTERSLPGIVAAALATLLVRTWRGQVDDARLRLIMSACDALEVLARSNDSGIRELLLYEVFENMDLAEGEWIRISIHFGPTTSRLLSEWRQAEGA